MFAVGSLLFAGVSAKCEMTDIMALIAGGGDSGEDERRRRLSEVDGMFGGLNPDCVPCATECITQAILSGMTPETQGADYYMCFFNCAEKAYEAPCAFEDLANIQTTQDEVFGNALSGGGDPGAGIEGLEDLFKDPFGSVPGLSKQCVKCQNTCVQETLVPALEALVGGLTEALSGGGNGAGSGGGAAPEDMDFEAQMTKMGHCSACCSGLDIGPMIAPGLGSCVDEFKAQIPAMFQGNSGGSSGDNTGMIVGIVVGVLALVLIVAGVGYYCHKKNSKLVDEEGPSSPMRPNKESGEPSISEV